MTEDFNLIEAKYRRSVTGNIFFINLFWYYMLYWLKLKFQRNLHFNVLFMKLYFVIQQRKTFNKGKKDKRSYGLNVSRQFWGSGWGSPLLDFNLQSFTLKIAVELFEGTTLLSGWWWLVPLDLRCLTNIKEEISRHIKDVLRTASHRQPPDECLLSGKLTIGSFPEM